MTHPCTARREVVVKRDLTDINCFTLRAGYRAFIRREFKVNGGRLVRIDLENIDGLLLMSCVDPADLEVVGGVE